MSVFNIFHIPSNVRTQIFYWVQLDALHPTAPPTTGYDPASADRFLTQQLRGQLNALLALLSEKDTPGSFYIEIGLWRRAVFHPARDRSPLVMDSMLRFRSGHHGNTEVFAWSIVFCKIK
jgi:hypothetical protein